MAVFFVTSTRDNPKVDAAIKNLFPDDHFQLGPGQWFVSAAGTTIDVSNALGITDGRNGSGVVLSVSAYYGRASNELWEWLKAKWELK